LTEASKIKDLWIWFEQNSRELQSDDFSENTLYELDSKVTDLGLRWEIGPGVVKENSLTISPSGDWEKLELAKNVHRLSPNMDSWEFYCFKQPKENWDLLELPKYGISLSARDWEYVLLQYKDGKKEILVKADSLEDIEPDYKEGIVEIVLTNLLGEETMMKEIDLIDLLGTESDDYELSELENIKEHIEQIKNGA